MIMKPIAECIRHSSRLPTLVCGLLLTLPVTAEEWVDAADFGLGKLPPGADATPVLRRAMEACIKEKASGLKVPAGEWHLFPQFAFEQNLAVANNDPGIRRVVFPIDGFEGFTLEADGARFVCHGPMIPISAEGTRDLTLKGFSIDWARPFSMQGTVEAVQPELNAFDLKLHPEVVYEIRGQRLIFREKPSPSPTTWKEWAPPVTDTLAWEHNLQWNMWFQGGTRHPLPGEGMLGLEPDARVEELGPHRIRIFEAAKVMPPVGAVLIVNGMMQQNRTSPAIRISGCKDVLVEDVTIHHAGGMGMVAQRSENFTIRRYKVVLPEGKDRYVTTTADATHFNGCRGHILIEDSLFENMLDDASNIHGCFVKVVKAEGNTLLCQRAHSMQLGLEIAEPGDVVRLVQSADLKPYGDATVTAVRNLNSEHFEITLDKLPEGGIRMPSGFYNISWQPSLTFRNNVVRNNRGRSILLATSGKVLVEKNRFEHPSMFGIQMEGDNDFWWESGPNRDVTIRDNHFLNTTGPVLNVALGIDPKRYPDALYHGGIVFENNLIETFHGAIMNGYAIDGLIVRNNTIRMTDFTHAYRPETASFNFASGRNIVMEGNRFTGNAEIPELDVKAGTPSAKPLMKDNQGIVLKP